jgi:hypothetical protein
MTRTLSTEREKTAERLLKSSANKFYDPEVDIDWDAELADGRFFIPQHRSSLYGTELWERMTEEQRIELTKHEVVSVATNGIWFEILLMQILLKQIYDADPTSSHAQYALTEIADECRHSTMFAKLAARVGVPAYGPVKWLRQVAKILPAIAKGPAAYGSVLVAEEILDRLQRDQMNDPDIQPLVRMVNRIHVLEEARHVTFAREEVVRGMPKLSRPVRAWQRLLMAIVSFAIVRTLINPAVYKAVGIRPRDGYRAAMANPYWQETLAFSGEKIMPFLRESGLVKGPGMILWRRSGLLPANR